MNHIKESFTGQHHRNSDAGILFLVCMAMASIPHAVASQQDAPPSQRAKTTTPSGDSGEMGQMAAHMSMTKLRPMSSGDQQSADALVRAATSAIARYKDYHKALADGYEIFL